MEVRLLSENELPEAKQLWKTAFGDSDCFIDTYFKNKVLPGNSPAIFDNGRLVCILHLIPYIIDIRGKAFDTAYIAGAATHPDYRNKGLMASLLHETLQILRQRGISVTHLYPFLHAFYERFGWATMSDMAHCKVKPTHIPGYTFSKNTDLDDIIRLYKNAMREYTGFLLRGKNDFKRRMEESACDGGKAAYAFKDGTLKAYAMYEVNGDAIEVFEPVFENQQALHALFEFLRGEEGAHEVGLSYPAHIRMHHSFLWEVKPYGMARITDVEALLKNLPFTHTTFIVKIKDGFAEWNEGIFEASYGNGCAKAERTDKAPQIETDILSLAQLIHGYAGLSDLCHYGRLILHDKSMLREFKRLFPEKKTFVFEAF